MRSLSIWIFKPVILRSGYFFIFIFLNVFANAQKAELVIPVGHTSPVVDMCISNDSKWVATASWDNTAKIWDIERGHLLHELKGHTGSLTNIAISPNNQFIITSSKDSTCRVWRSVNGKPEFILKKQKDWISQSFFTHNGKWIISCSWDKTICIWNAKNGNLIKTLYCNGPVLQSDVSKDDRILASVSLDSTLRVYNIPNFKLLYTIKFHQQLEPLVSFSRNSKRLAIACGGSIKILNSLSGTVFLELNSHQQAVSCLAWCSNNESIASGSNDSTAIIWNVESGSKLRSLHGHNGGITSVSFSSDDHYIITSSKDSTSILWNKENGSIVNQFKGHTGIVNKAIFDVQDSIILTASSDNTGIIWRFHDSVPLHILKGHVSLVNGLKFSGDENLLLTYSWDNMGRIWNKSGEIRTLLKGHDDLIYSGVFSPDSKKILTTSADNTAIIWNTDDGSLIYKLTGHSDVVSDGLFSPDQKWILTTSWDQTARLWNAHNGQLLHTLTGHTNAISKGAFSYDGKIFATASWDGTARVYNVSEGKLLSVLKGHRDQLVNIHFSHNNSYILTCSNDSTARIWNVAQGQCIHTLTSSASLTNAVFSNDDQYIFTCSSDGTAALWSTEKGNRIFILKAHDAPVTGAYFFKDNDRVLTYGKDNVIRIWKIPEGKLITEFSGHDQPITSVSVNEMTNQLVSSSEDHTMKKWNLLSGKLLYTFIPVDETDYLSIDAEGRYDGTELAKSLLHYVCNNEIIDLEQAKMLSWEPFLVNKISGYDKEPITAKGIKELNLCDITPLIKDNGLTDQHYHYSIYPRSGGLSRIEIYINHKLIAEYSVNELEKNNNSYHIKIPEEIVNKYKSEQVRNQLMIKAYTQDQNLVSRGPVKYFNPDKKVSKVPNLYLVCIGVSKYKSAKLNLQFAGKDATDLYEVLETAGKNLLNSYNHQHVFSYLFTTDGKGYWPTKKILSDTMEYIAKNAGPDDIIVVFYAGHGVLETNGNNFYLLTSDAFDDNITENAKTVAFSLDEIKKWLEQVRSNKLVLMLDACNSGKLLETFNLTTNKREIPADQQRVLENLREKTGINILCASASGQSAYETNLFNQGLLTYSILSGIKYGDGLKDDKYIDVNRLFIYASDQVKLLAKNIGGRQDPQILGNAGFLFGMVDSNVINNINLTGQKKIFRNSRFIEDTELLNDDLDFSSLIDRTLKEFSENNREASFVFAGSNAFYNDFSVRGKYTLSGHKLHLQVFLFKGQDQRIANFEMEGNVDQKELLAKNIVSHIQQQLMKQPTK